MAPKTGEAVVEKMEVDEVKPEIEEPPKDLNAIAIENIKDQMAAIDRGEEHLMARVLQALPKTRKQINSIVLYSLISSQISRNDEFAGRLLRYIPDGKPVEVKVEEMDTSTAKKSPKKAVKVIISTAESDCYLRLLLVVHMYQQGRFPEAIRIGEEQLGWIEQNDKRSLDGICAKTIYFMCVIHEKEKTLFNIRSQLNSRLRTVTLRHYPESQAVLICWLLRLYLFARQYQSAAHFVSKVAFPENASNNDLARYMYYQGRIKALQLDYNSAAGYFLQAMRKAPQEGAIGFKQAVQKWVVVIGLLQGEIPERNVFRQPIYRKCLAQYLDLTHAVRLGDIAKFNRVLEQYRTVFEADDTLTLIVRLRQNVIKTAIKQISAAYSRIYIKDIAKKLLMENETETELIVAKAIADGSIDAVITSDVRDGPRYMQSSETADIYRTSEPQAHFDSRIRYCLELHNQAVKALRYPPKKKIAVESIEQAREREQQEMEFAKELADEEDDEF